MARDIEAPPSADDRMARRAPKDKDQNKLTTKVKEMMNKKREEDRKDMSFDEKFKTANTKESKTMMAKGGAVKGYKKGGSVSSCSKRADGIAQRGKTKCKMV